MTISASVVHSERASQLGFVLAERRLIVFKIRKFLFPIVALLAISLVAAACGSDDGGTAAPGGYDSGYDSGYGGYGGYDSGYDSCSGARRG